MNLKQKIDKSGYVLIDNVGLDHPDQSLKDHLSSFAKPIAYLDLPLVMDLKPQPGYQPASFAGTGEFDMHTDLSWYKKPPKYIAMFCVANESHHGGIPLLSDGWAALADLNEDDATCLKTQNVSFPSPDHINYPALDSPIIDEQSGQLKVRFRYDMLDNPPEPVHRYFKSINHHIIQLNAKPGSLFIFDNERMLHGRTELKAGIKSDRFFKRMYGEAVGLC